MTTARLETPDEQSATEQPMQTIDPIPEPDRDGAHVEGFEAVSITKSKETIASLAPAAPPPESTQTNIVGEQSRAQDQRDDSDSSGDDEDDDVDSEDDEDDEPRLNYARMTQNLTSVYRNGDATSAFLVAGDKMIIGTHNGNIHVIQLPTFKTIRVYHAHSASVTSISISPFPPPLPSNNSMPRPTATMKESDASPSTPKKSREPQQIPRIPSNDIYIATASMDGNVCVQSLLDFKDVQLRSFGRPVQCVALSPTYKSDRMYISGGLAGHFVLTTGGQPGRSTSTTTGTAAAAAAGWLGSVGLAGNAAKDTILHSGEGTISCVRWSLSGKFVMWLNEHGIKIMRTSLHLESSSSDDDAWTRIGHIDRPQTQEWETMASVWKGRAEWIDENSLEVDSLRTTTDGEVAKEVNETQVDSERLLIGWGETIWIVHVHSGKKRGAHVSGKSAGRAEIVKILRMDCIISGLALYTKNLLLVLAFCNPDEEDENIDNDEHSARRHRARESITSTGSQPSGGIRRRQNNLPPELRLIDLDSQMEIDKYSLPVSRYERLFAADYQLSILPARSAASAIISRGALETLTGFGVDIWHAATNPKTLFSSGASILSRDSGEDASSKVASTSGTLRGTPSKSTSHPIDLSMSKPGAKIFIQSPYDCILATKRDLTDHLKWLAERNDYAKAWEVLDENPDILSFIPEKQHGYTSSISSQPAAKLDELIDEDSIAESTNRHSLSATEKEKRRIGELWIQQLVGKGQWKAAGITCGKVIGTSDKWEKWVWAFAGANKFDEIVDFIPAVPLVPPIPTTVYEVVLGHYIQSDKIKFSELLNCWSLDLFDTKAVAKALENQLKFRDVRADSVENGERGRDWMIVTESLAKLYEAGGRFREALKAYVKLHDPDNTFRLIKDNHLAEAVVDDIPAFISLRVPDSKLDHMTEAELAVATSEPISVLVDAAQRGLVTPKTIVDQLHEKKMMQYLYFYLRALWAGQGMKEQYFDENNERLLLESKLMVDEFADLAIHLFAIYNRPLLMEVLKTSTAYTFEKAAQECEEHEFYDELVYLYSKTGQMKRALYLIIDRLHDVQKAIDFAKEQDDPDLWEVLLSYSMDKPKFIRALLEQVGTAINPINLVKRIPAGLEIQGLREGLTHMMKEHELQHSISSGAARVLRSEVATTQGKLRTGQRRGIKFEPPSLLPPDTVLARSEENKHDLQSKTLCRAGHCAQCGEKFTAFEMETLLGYSCGHVFHISHLLELLGLDETANDDFNSRVNDSGRYLVGMKVMKARLLRDKVKVGCPLCKANVT